MGCQAVKSGGCPGWRLPGRTMCRAPGRLPSARGAGTSRRPGVPLASGCETTLLVDAGGGIARRVPLGQPIGYALLYGLGPLSGVLELGPHLLYLHWCGDRGGWATAAG